jgi:hypothetical protein
MSDKDKTDLRYKYTTEDIDRMNFRMGVIEDFVGVLDRNDEKDNVSLSSVAFILKMLLEPIGDFLSWAVTYADIPGEEPDKAGESL